MKKFKDYINEAGKDRVVVRSTNKGDFYSVVYKSSDDARKGATAGFEPRKMTKAFGDPGDGWMNMSKLNNYQEEK